MGQFGTPLSVDPMLFIQTVTTSAYCLYPVHLSRHHRPTVSTVHSLLSYCGGLATGVCGKFAGWGGRITLPGSVDQITT